MSTPKPKSSVMAAPSDRDATTLSPISVANPAIQKTQPQPYDRSRPRYAPSANRPAVTATRPIVWPSKVPASSRVIGAGTEAVFEITSSSFLVMISVGSVTVRLRNDVSIQDPLGVVLGFLERWAVQPAGASAPTTFAEPDLRLANRGGARISAAEIAAILERRRAIERALRAIPPGVSLTRARVPWQPLQQLFDAFADIRGVGYSKVTKALNPKRPALIPMLDSVVQSYLDADDPGP